MLHSIATICAMCYPKKGSGIYQKILLSRPRGPTGQYIYPLTMYYCVLYDHATRPRFPLGHDTEVAIMVLNKLIISKIIF